MKANWLKGVVLFAAAILFSVGASAANRSPPPQKDHVEPVLRDELTSTVDRRARLAETISRQPDLAAARWQAGFVREKGVWRSFDDESWSSRAEGLLPYRSRREDTVATPADQIALADWCRGQGLPDQERAHLTEALRLARDQELPDVRLRLGQRKITGTWLSAEQVSEILEANREAQESLEKWGARLARVAKRLSGHRAQREAARTELSKIVDPSAVPALEFLLSGIDEASALLVIEVLGRFEGPVGSLPLARQAVFSKWPKTRESAARALRSRPLESFVPPLISLLATPIKSSFRMTQPRAGGPLLYSYVLARETDDQFQVLSLNTVSFLAGNALAGSRGDTQRALASARGQNDAERELAGRLLQREDEVERWNERTNELNGRIGAALAIVSGREPSANASDWWAWWSEYTDTDTSQPKRVVIVDETEFQGTPTAAECFGAGTPVWTETGLVPLESLRVGDRVLSKDVETGELAYKPVLGTTVRPSKVLMTLRFTGETLVCTGGHRLWVSGTGWVKARDLVPQTLLHTVTGNTPVSIVKSGESAETYNLVVGDFHTYFVGNTGLLSQDVLIPRATNKVVPGLEKPKVGAHTNN